jgi:hypothetical protein
MRKKNTLQVEDVFHRSMFYVGGSTDVQPLLRFSHLTDTLISPTLSDIYTDVESYERAFKSKCGHLNAYYGFNLLTYEGSERIAAEGVAPLFVNDFPNVFTPEDIFKYRESFGGKVSSHEPVQAIRFKFTRTITPHIQRQVSWIWLQAEGMSSLDSLVRLTGKSPLLIITIQTGIMEDPRGLFARYLQTGEINSKIWVRGFWNYSISEFQKISYFRYENCLPPFQHHVQCYPNWYSSMGQPMRMVEECGEHTSNVHAFARDPIDVTANISFGHARKRTTIIAKDIHCADPLEYDLIITSERIWKSEFKKPANLIFWEDLFRFRTGHPYKPVTAYESLQKIQWLKRFTGFVKIAITPVGYEDEDMVYKKFNWRGEILLDVYHLDPLDFISLKARDYFNA